jgi:hypothetical protein
MRTNLEILLGDWGHWKALQDDAGLGYPSEAAFSKMRVDCNVHQGAAVSVVDPDVRKVDGLIMTLHPMDRAVLLAHYKRTGPVKAKHDELGLSRRDYYYHLDACHRHLSHGMGGRYMRGYETKVCALVE